MLELAANYANYANFSMQWVSHLAQVLGREPCVLVTLNLILGSAPREAGCRDHESQVSHHHLARGIQIVFIEQFFCQLLLLLDTQQGNTVNRLNISLQVSPRG